MFDKLVDPQSTGTLMAEMRDLASRASNQNGMELPDTDTFAQEDASNTKKAKDVPLELRNAIRVAFGEFAPTKIIPSSDTKISGFVHSTITTHVGNSQIYFSAPFEFTTTPGFIHYIFSCPNIAGQYLAVRRLLPCEVEDPFSAFPILGVKLYSNVVDELEVISVDDVDAQFASCPLEWDGKSNFAVISLSRVSTFGIYRDTELIVHHMTECRPALKILRFLPAHGSPFPTYSYEYSTTYAFGPISGSHLSLFFSIELHAFKGVLLSVFLCLTVTCSVSPMLKFCLTFYLTIFLSVALGAHALIRSVLFLRKCVGPFFTISSSDRGVLERTERAELPVRRRAMNE